jgi:hypothetical protein
MPKKEQGKRVSNQVINYIIISIVNSKARSSIVQFLKGSHKHTNILIKQKGSKQRLYIFYRPGITKKSVPIIEKRLITYYKD